MNIRVTFGQLGHRPSDLDSPHGFAIGRREEIIVADTYHHLIKVQIVSWIWASKT
jgi:hypothetical protein